MVSIKTKSAQMTFDGLTDDERMTTGMCTKGVVAMYNSQRDAGASYNFQANGKTMSMNLKTESSKIRLQNIKDYFELQSCDSSKQQRNTTHNCAWLMR